MKKKNHQKKNKIKEQIIALSTLFNAIDFIISDLESIANFVQKVLFS